MIRNQSCRIEEAVGTLSVQFLKYYLILLIAISYLIIKVKHAESPSFIMKNQRLRETE